MTYGGFRLSGLYRFSDDWDLLIQQSYQQIQADGYFYAYPVDSNGHALQPDQITAFTPAYNKDRYESTAWILNGRFGDLKAVYAGSYMRRHIEAQQDYSNYLRGTGGTYYDCIGAGAAYFNPAYFSQLEGKPLQCYAPVGAWHDSVQNEHQSHEVRLSTHENSRVRALVGAYWEKFVISDDMNFNYLGIPQCSAANLAIALAGGADCLSAVGPFPGSYASDPGLRENMNNAFGQDVRRGYKQYAFFASVDFDILPKVLTLTAGTRRYHYDEFEEGSVWPSCGNHQRPHRRSPQRGLHGRRGVRFSDQPRQERKRLPQPRQPDLAHYCGHHDLLHLLPGFPSGWFQSNQLASGSTLNSIGVAYYCGGPTSFDPRCRNGGDLDVLNKAGGTAQLVKPYSYTSDNLINHELGFKSEFLNHRLRINASAYLMHWNDVQSMPQGAATYVLQFTNIVNGPSYTVKGLELQLTARMTEGLTLEGAGSWNSSQQASDSCLKSAGVTPLTPNNPTPAGQCITVVKGQRFALGVLNGSIPYSSPLIFNLRAHYDWHVGDYRPFAWVGVSHIAASSNEPENFPDGNAPVPAESGVLRYTIPAYTTYDAALGVSKDRWKAQLTGSNLSNSNAATNISSAQFIKATIPLRPRVVMFLFSYTF